MRSWIRNLKRHKVSEGFTERVLREARNLSESPSKPKIFAWGRLFHGLAGQKHEALPGDIRLAPLIARLAFACVLIGAGTMIWQNHFQLPSQPDFQVSQMEDLTQELASLEAVLDWVESESSEILMDHPDQELIVTDSVQDRWVNDLEPVQIIALDGIQPDEELLDLMTLNDR